MTVKKVLDSPRVPRLGPHSQAVLGPRRGLELRDQDWACRDAKPDARRELA